MKREGPIYIGAEQRAHELGIPPGDWLLELDRERDMWAAFARRQGITRKRLDEMLTGHGHAPGSIRLSGREAVDV